MPTFPMPSAPGMFGPPGMMPQMAPGMPPMGMGPPPGMAPPFMPPQGMMNSMP